MASPDCGGEVAWRRWRIAAAGDRPIDEKSFGPDHPNVAIRLNNLGVALPDTDRLSEAEPLFRRALAILEKSRGPDDPSAKRVREYLQELRDKWRALTTSPAGSA
jgi:hypothetical protein